MEIERKFTVKQLPERLSDYPYHQIEQGYLCTEPVVRIRRQDEEYYLTYKSKGLMAREEYNLPLTEAAYGHLRTKADGNFISKRRYMIPFDRWTIELDIFEGCFKGLILAEVEFDTVDSANGFVPPDWFDADVTCSTRYHNSTMSTADPAEYGCAGGR